MLEYVQHAMKVNDITLLVDEEVISNTSKILWVCVYFQLFYPEIH